MLNNWLHKRSAALSDARKFAYHDDLSHFLRSIRLAFHLVPRIIQHFPKGSLPAEKFCINIDRIGAGIPSSSASAGFNQM